MQKLQPSEPPAVAPNNPQAPDPSVPTAMWRKLSEIEPYDRNPRRVPNQRFDAIKASVFTRGLETPLPITRRPGNDRYTVSKGGNTRLKILTELYEETGEPRFFEIRCDFTPWVSESDTLLAHLTENDQRGKLFFIDRARGLRELQTLLEKETGRTFSVRRFAEQLKRLGYSQDIGTIARMNYALDVLLPAIPQALAAGMGRRQIDAIRRLDQAAGRLWQQLGIEDAFRPVWTALLRRHDGERWDPLRFRTAIEKELEVTADRDGFEIIDALDRLLRSEDNVGLKTARTADAGMDTPVSLLKPPPARRDTRTKDTVPPRCATGLAVTDRRDVLPTLRATAWRVARRLAARHQLEATVARCAIGYGYIVKELPDLDRLNRLPRAERDKINVLWWQLVAFAEMTAAPRQTLAALVPHRSPLHALFDHRGENLTDAGLTPPAAGELGVRFWCAIDERDWRELVQLIKTCRRLRAVALAHAIDLWGEPP